MKVVLAEDRAVLFHGDSGKLDLPENSVDAIVCDPPGAIAFQGREWDKDKGGRDGWVKWLADTLAPSFRALKPGAHGLVWAIPRTSHWTALALELAGFQIRDRIGYVFLNGNPKSVNISKAIDAHLGTERPVIGPNPNARPIDGAGGGYSGPTSHDPELSAPGSPEADQWDGWGTALKPACEDWWLVRKPLTGTIVESVLTNGTGALNIGACRVGDGSQHVGREGEASAQRRYEHNGNTDFAMTPGPRGGDPRGNWPPHLVADEDGGAMIHPNAQRYFYCPKPSRREKDAGCEHLPLWSPSSALGRKEGSAGLGNARAGAGRTRPVHNHHETVKSIALMRWLIRLITPPGGVVLDPFAGSGTTGVAALAEGASVILCEMTDEYLPIIEGRLRDALKETP